MPRLTTAQKQIQLDLAYEKLEGVKALRTARAKFVRSAFANFGDHGALISGVERDHFPADIKDLLRANARAIADGLEQARSCWRASGKRLNTFRRVSANYRVDGSRY